MIWTKDSNAVKRGILFLLSALALTTAKAQSDSLWTDKTTTRVTMMGLGRTETLDTYLSPEKYRGAEISYLSHTTFERDNRRLSRQIIHQGIFSSARNRAENARELYAMYRFGYAWHYNWSLCQQKLTLKVGAMLNAHVGTLYNARNANNPMQAKISTDIAASVVASYRFSIRNQPFAVRYETEIPLIGLMFSPNYGQSYYEIFSKGHYDHNILPTYLGNAPSLGQMLTLDCSVGNTTWRIGYWGDYRQAAVNRLKYHTYSHALVIGFVKKFKLINLRP